MQASGEVSLSPMSRGPYYGADLVGLVKSHMGLHLTCIEKQASLQACPVSTNQLLCWYLTLIKNKNKIFLIYKKIQMGSVAKSSMRNGFLIYEEMRNYLTIYEEAVSHI